MGTVNLRKLSKEVKNEIIGSNAVYVKGCRSHEMLQGGIKAVTYTSFVVAREFTETETGLDARTSLIVFFRNKPGEYAYWGFKMRSKRRKDFPDGRKIAICGSTLCEHEKRKTEDVTSLIQDLKKLTRLFSFVPSCYRISYDNETEMIVDRFGEFTKTAYNEVAQLYADIRHERPSDVDTESLNKLIEMARSRMREGLLGDLQEKISILDVGTGSGRDLRYLKGFADVNAVGIDNADAFIEMLGELEQKGEISKKSFYNADMRNLSMFRDSTFDVVRHNASLLHVICSA